MKVQNVIACAAVALAAPTPADDVNPVQDLSNLLGQVGLPLPSGTPSGGANLAGGLPVDNLFTTDPLPNAANSVLDVLKKVLDSLTGH